MELLGFFRTSMFYNRIWDDLVVLTFFYDTVSKVGMCAFILKRISRIILFSENCIFQTMTEGPRLLVVKLCHCTIVYFLIIIFCLYSIAQKVIYLLFSFSFGLRYGYNRIIGIEFIAPLAQRTFLVLVLTQNHISARSTIWKDTPFEELLYWNISK